MKKLFFSLALAFAFLQCNGAILPAEKLLTKDTVALFTITDMQKSCSTFSNSPYGQLWNDPSCKAFKDKLLTKFKTEIQDPTEKQLGIKFADYEELLQGQFTVAVIQNAKEGDDAFGFVLLIDTKDKAPKLKSLLADTQKKWTDSGKKIKTQQIRSIDFATYIITGADLTNTVAKIVPSNSSSTNKNADGDDDDNANAAASKTPEKIELTVGISDSLLIISTSPKAIEKVLTRQSGGLIPALEEEPLFQADYAAHFRNAPGYTWVNAKALLTTFVKPGEDSASPFDPQKILSGLGISNLRTIGVSWQELPEGYQTQVFLDVPEADRKGIFKLIAADAKECNPPAFVPADAVEFVRWRMDLPKFWNNLEAMLNEVFPPLMVQINAGLDKIGKEKDEKFDLKTELLSSLGNDLITYKKNPKGTTLADLSAPPTIFLIGSPKPEKLAVTLKTAIDATVGASGAFSLKESDFLGRKLYTLASQASGSNTTILCFAPSGSYLAISVQSPIVEEYLRSTDNKGKSLSDTTPGLNEAAQKVGGMNTGLFGFNNQKEQMRLVFDILHSGNTNLAEVFGMKNLPGPAAQADPFKKINEWADFSLLPPFDAVAKYFYFGVYSGGFDANGYTLNCFAPFPPKTK